jgi:hypothetical protein
MSTFALCELTGNSGLDGKTSEPILTQRLAGRLLFGT